MKNNICSINLEEFEDYLLDFFVGIIREDLRHNSDEVLVRKDSIQFILNYYNHTSSSIGIWIY